jgi:hypothetical protein
MTRKEDMEDGGLHRRGASRRSTGGARTADVRMLTRRRRLLMLPRRNSRGIARAYRSAGIERRLS